MKRFKRFSNLLLFSFSLILLVSSGVAQENATQVSESLGEDITLQEYEFNDDKASWFVFDSETVTTLNVIDYHSIEEGEVNTKSSVLTSGRNNVTIDLTKKGGNQRILATANDEFITVDNNVESDFIGTVEPSGFVAGIISSGLTVLAILVILKSKKTKERENTSWKVL